MSDNAALGSGSVQVERWPVPDADRLFRDRTIEAERYSEEAVIQKDVRVTEEIPLLKHLEQRTNTVSDVVRRTELEVRHERGT